MPFQFTQLFVSSASKAAQTCRERASRGVVRGVYTIYKEDERIWHHSKWNRSRTIWLQPVRQPSEIEWGMTVIWRGICISFEFASLPWQHKQNCWQSRLRLPTRCFVFWKYVLCTLWFDDKRVIRWSKSVFCCLCIVVWNMHKETSVWSSLEFVLIFIWNPRRCKRRQQIVFSVKFI